MSDDDNHQEESKEAETIAEESKSKSTCDSPSTKVESVLKAPKYTAGTTTTTTTTSDDENKDKENDQSSPNTTAESRRVSFSHVEDSVNEFRPLPKGQLPTRSVRFGKADPVRDLGIVAGILLCFVLVSVYYQDVGYVPPEDDGDVVLAFQKNANNNNNNNKGGSSLGRLKKLHSALGVLLEQQFGGESVRHEGDCGLFYARSSIPRTGLGIFAGRNYSVGDEIMNLNARTMLVEASSTLKRLWIAPEALVLKHHPTLPNVHPSMPLWTTMSEPSADSSSSSNIVLKATQPIFVGQELFLQFDQHLHSVLPEWFDQILPTVDDYAEADWMILEARNTFREPRGPTGRKLNKYQQTGVLGQALEMVQRVVARYRPAVSKLLPSALQSLSQYRGRANDVTSLYLALQNQTSSNLGRNALCLSDVTQKMSKDENGKTGLLITSRNVTQGRRVHAMPILVRLKSKDVQETNQECQPENEAGDGSCLSERLSPRTCWSRPDALVELCPLHPLPAVDMAQTESDGATVELQWSKWYEATDTTDADLSVVGNEKQRLEQIWIMELVALRDLAAGDKLTIGMGQDEVTGDWIVPKELLPAKWMAA